MGLIKQGIAFGVVLIVVTYFRTLFETRLPTNVDGHFHPAFKRAADKFRSTHSKAMALSKFRRISGLPAFILEVHHVAYTQAQSMQFSVTYAARHTENVESGKEPGGAIAVYYKGELVLDMWGGYADREAERPWLKDTMTIAFSVSKCIAAIIVATMVERGYLDYSRPVADYWPEFAQNDKSNITVEMLLSHQGGLVALDKPVSLADIRTNREKVEDSLVAQKPAWPPGTAHGYHTLTYGPYMDTLIRKTDPKGRTTPEIFQEEIAKPFGIDLYMATPRDQWYRVAKVQPLYSTIRTMVEALMSPVYRSSMMDDVFNSDSLMARSFLSVSDFTLDEKSFNNPYTRETTFSCAMSTGTARGYAKLLGILGNGGVLGDQRLLGNEYIRKLATPLTSGMDRTLGAHTTYGPGTFITKGSMGQTFVGHPGHGGQDAIVDLENNLSIAYLTNYISIYGSGDDPRYTNVQTEVYKCLEEYKKQKKT